MAIIKLKPDSYANERVLDKKWKNVEINTYLNKENLYLFANYTQPNFNGIYSFNISSQLCTRVFPFIKVPVHSILIGNETIVASNNKLLFITEQNITKEIVIPELKGFIIYNLKQINNDLYFQHYHKITGERKLSKFNMKTNQLQVISDEIGTKSMISDFFIDKENNIWITTYGSGVYYLKTHEPNLFDNSIITETEINDFKWYNDHLLLLTPNWLYLIQKNVLIDQVNVPNNQESFQINQEKGEVQILSKYPLEPGHIGPFTVKGIGSKAYDFKQDSTKINISYNNINLSNSNKNL